jgi:retron-type reverse transcriptase
MNERLSSENISTRLQRVAELSRLAPDMVLTTLAHHIDIEFLKEAYRRMRKSAAPGVDGQTAADYAKDLDANLQNLLNRFKSGTYKAPPVRRVYIPKGDGTNRQRALGLPCAIDRFIQTALQQVFQKHWDRTFSPHSYGFRPGKSQHQAIKQAQKYVGSGLRWVVDLDLEKFFDRVNHDILLSRIAKRVKDKRVLKLVRAFLNAGMMEDGLVKPTEEGVPQGGFTFTNQEQPRRRIAPVALKKVKDKIRKLTCRKRGNSLKQIIEELASYLHGWIGYFGYCETPTVLRDLEKWLRRKLRCLIWKRWKHGTTRFERLRALGLTIHQAREGAGSGARGPWRMSQTSSINSALSIAYFQSMGLPPLKCLTTA